MGSRYVLFDRIGAGSMGQVYRAGTRDGGDPDLAVKILRPELASEKTLVRRFLNEWDVLRSLDGPHVARVLDLVHEGDTLALVMPLVRGGSLRDHLVAEEGRLDLGEARDLAVQVLRGLAEAHAKGIVHRDVKPENVLLEREGGRLVAKVADFGISAIVRDTTFTRLTSVVGTAQYMAPELLVPDSQATAAVDVYAAGVLLYELVAGRPPFAGEQPLAIMYQAAHEEPPRPPGIGDPVWDVLRSMLAKEPGARPSAEEAASRLAAVTLQPAARSDTPGPGDTIVRPQRRGAEGRRRRRADGDPLATRHVSGRRPLEGGGPPAGEGPPVAAAEPEPEPEPDDLAGTDRRPPSPWRRPRVLVPAVVLVALVAAAAAFLATRPSGAPAARSSTTTAPAIPSSTTTVPSSSSTTSVTVPSGPHWRTATSLGAGVAWTSVSCTSAQFCIASGSRAAGAGIAGSSTLAAVYRDGSWSALHLIDSRQGQTQGVACANSTSCVAIDVSSDVVTFDGHTWSSAIRLDDTPSSLVSISCPTATFCAAADNVGNVSTFTGHAAAGTTDVDNSEPNDNTSISCPTSTFCGLIDLGGYFFTYNGRSWSQGPRDEAQTSSSSNDLPGWGSALSCASSSFCVALDGKGDAVTFNGHGWSKPVPIDTSGHPDSVSCPRRTFCIAVDGAGAEAVYDDGHWSTPGSTGTSFPLNAVSCPTPTFCMAVGDDGTVVSFR